MISGYLAMLTTLLLWAGFFLSLRASAHSDLTVADIALTRFILPSIILLPLVVNSWHLIKRIPARYLLGLFIGSGLPYFLVAANGMQLAPVSDGSTLIPGTLPLFVSAIAVLLFKQPLSSHRVIGLASICLGVGTFLTYGAHSGSIFGYVLFLCGSLMWATFTICARVSNIHPLVTAGLVSLASSVSLVILISIGTLDSYLFNHPVAEWPLSAVTTHVLLQGLGAGTFAAFTYLHAISKLGAERTAAFGAATPAIATALAVPLFSEQPSFTVMIAMSLICMGSLVASNIFLKADTSLDYRPPSYR